jgi:putative ABC transport system permease protein
VTFTDRLPATGHPRRRVEVEGESADASAGTLVGIATVADDYFDVLGAQMLSGRGFHRTDMTGASQVVVVNRAFVTRVLSGRNPVGRRVRYGSRGPLEPASPWYEIVGVVPDLGIIDDGNGAGIYHPMRPDATTLYIALRVKGDPVSFAPRLRTVVAEVDPSVRVQEVLPLDEVGASGWNEMDFLWRLLALVSALALILSLATIYSMTSLIVSRRTREIGIRIALGADARRIVAAMFSRPLTQVCAGVLLGGALVFVFTRVVAGLSVREVVGIAAYVVVMTGVCMLGCLVPTRRALRVEPTEALRIE